MIIFLKRTQTFSQWQQNSRIIKVVALKTISQPDFPNSVEEGDYVVYAGDDDRIVNAIESSFPHINTNMLSIPEFSELYQDRNS